MAKSRTRSGKNPRGTRKAARRRATPGPRRVQLKPVFTSLTTSIDRLQRAQQTAAVKKALARLSRCLKSLDGICGSDMAIPVTKE